MEFIIKSDNLSFKYPVYSEDNSIEEVYALKDASISIKKGEFVAILGHNGSGKSTFAKHINCLLSPFSGTLIVNNLSALIEDNIYSIRQNVGMVFQNPDNQIIATTVEEDVAFGPENLNIDPNEIRTRVDNALASVGMSEFMKHPPHHLSGGQKQRIAIAGILAMKPQIIVLDEPTAMLDPIGRKEVINTIKKLSKEGITIVFITHYMEEAAEADRIIIMKDGSIYDDGCPASIFSKIEELKSIGLDVPQAAEIAHRLKKEGLDIPENIIKPDELVEALCLLK